MISAIILAVAGLSTPAAAPAASFGADTVRSLKGHPALPARSAESKTANLPAACHPDPTKRRICRHHIVQAEQDRREARALAAANSRAEMAE